MDVYYTVEWNTKNPAPTPEIYDYCLNFDYSTPHTICPLCGRSINGATWKGPYDFFCRSKNLPGMVIAWYPSGRLVMNGDFLRRFRERGLIGIDDTTECRIFYRKQPIDIPFFIPKIAFSQKLIPYAMAKNEERKTNKNLPRCSLCMVRHSPIAHDYYFNQEKEYDIFRRYDDMATIYCTGSFRDFCLEMNIPGFIFRHVSN